MLNFDKYAINSVYKLVLISGIASYVCSMNNKSYQYI